MMVQWVKCLLHATNKVWVPRTHVKKPGTVMLNYKPSADGVEKGRSLELSDQPVQ